MNIDIKKAIKGIVSKIIAHHNGNVTIVIGVTLKQ